MTDTPEYTELLDLMEFLSQKYTHTNWQENIEHLLWQQVISNPRDGLPLTAEERMDLKGLADALDGWIFWSDERQNPAFIPMKDWKKIHSIYKVEQMMKANPEPEPEEPVQFNFMVPVC